MGGELFDIPYDGGDIGSFQGFGTMGMPGYSETLLAYGGGPNASFFPSLTQPNAIASGTPLTVASGGLVQLTFPGGSTLMKQAVLLVNGHEQDTIPTEAGNRWYRLKAFVRPGDTVSMSIWGTGAATTEFGHSSLLFYPSSADSGSVAAAVCISY